jgi:hypothetical protein
MFWRRRTDEFSIIAPLYQQPSDEVEKLRQKLPKSQYPEERPHITLLESVHTPRRVSDKQIYMSLKPALDLILDRETNADTDNYGKSSLIDLMSSKELDNIRGCLMAAVEKEDFIINKTGLSAFHPHVTVRLGVPFTEEVAGEAKQLFPPGKKILFSGWILNRLVINKGRRLFYEVRIR